MNSFKPNFRSKPANVAGSYFDIDLSPDAPEIGSRSYQPLAGKYANVKDQLVYLSLLSKIPNLDEETKGKINTAFTTISNNTWGQNTLLSLS